MKAKELVGRVGLPLFLRGPSWERRGRRILTRGSKVQLKSPEKKRG